MSSVVINDHSAKFATTTAPSVLLFNAMGALINFLKVFYVSP